MALFEGEVYHCYPIEAMENITKLEIAQLLIQDWYQDTLRCKLAIDPMTCHVKVRQRQVRLPCRCLPLPTLEQKQFGACTFHLRDVSDRSLTAKVLEKHEVCSRKLLGTKYLLRSPLATEEDQATRLSLASSSLFQGTSIDSVSIFKKLI